MRVERPPSESGASCARSRCAGSRTTRRTRRSTSSSATPASRSGLELYEDVTQGLGPEVVRTSKTMAGSYHVGVRYFAAGPMGISRGVVIVTRGDDVEIHPFRLAKGGGDIRYVAEVRVN